MERLLKWALEIFGLWLIAIVLGLLFGDVTFGEMAIGSLITAVIIRIGFHFETGSDTNLTPKNSMDSMISCRDCGYVGVGHGHCPRCGSTLADRLTSHTTMISCRKCGYIGAGSGHYPKCGWTRVTKIQ